MLRRKTERKICCTSFALRDGAGSLNKKKDRYEKKAISFGGEGICAANVNFLLKRAHSTREELRYYLSAPGNEPQHSSRETASLKESIHR